MSWLKERLETSFTFALDQSWYMWSLTMWTLLGYSDSAKVLYIVNTLNGGDRGDRVKGRRVGFFEAPASLMESTSDQLTNQRQWFLNPSGSLFCKDLKLTFYMQCVVWKTTKTCLMIIRRTGQLFRTKSNLLQCVTHILYELSAHWSKLSLPSCTSIPESTLDGPSQVDQDNLVPLLCFMVHM